MPDNETDTHTHPNKTALRSPLWLSWILGQLAGPSPILCYLCVPGFTVREWLLDVMLEGGSEEAWLSRNEHLPQ